MTKKHIKGITLHRIVTQGGLLSILWFQIVFKWQWSARPFNAVCSHKPMIYTPNDNCHHIDPNSNSVFHIFTL